jgi:hypothetical protein
MNINLQEVESHRPVLTPTGRRSSLTPSVPASNVQASKEEYKMVLCVNTELKMTKGKIAAQCCHAAVAVVLSRL